MQPVHLFLFLLVQFIYSWFISHLMTYTVPSQLFFFSKSWENFAWTSFLELRCYTVLSALGNAQGREAPSFTVPPIYVFRWSCGKECSSWLLSFVPSSCTSHQNLLWAFLNAPWVVEDALLTFSMPNEFSFLSLSSSDIRCSLLIMECNPHAVFLLLCSLTECILHIFF